MQDLLEWVLGAGSGVIIYAVLEEWGSALSAKTKRYVVVLGTIALIIGAYALSIWFDYNTMPPSPQAWAEAVAPYIVASLGISQLIHGTRQL